MKSLVFLLIAISAIAQPRSITVTGRTSGSFLGVGVAEITSERAKELRLSDDRGVEVKFIAEGSPAAKAGIRAEDVVLELNGQRIEGMAQFIRLVSEVPVGRRAALSLWRAGSPLSLSVVLEPRSNASLSFAPFGPTPPLPPTIVMPDLPRAGMSWRNGKLGIETETLNSQLADYFGVKEGILVRMVTRQSAAEKAGVKAGDVIVKADGKPIGAPHDVTALLPNRKSIALGIVRNHKDVTLEVNLDGL